MSTPDELAASLRKVAEGFERTTESIRELQAENDQDNPRIEALVRQISGLSGSLGFLANRIDLRMPESPNRQYMLDAHITLQGCEALTSAIETRIANIRRLRGSGLVHSDDSPLAWGDAAMNDLTKMVDNHIKASQVLHSALGCQSSDETETLLQTSASREAFELIKDNSSSLLRLYDTESLHTQRTAGTQDTGALNAQFDFDREIFNSRAYRAAAQSNRVLIADNPPRPGSLRRESEPSTTGDPLWLRVNRRFSIRSERLHDEDDASAYPPSYSNPPSYVSAQREPPQYQVQGRSPRDRKYRDDDDAQTARFSLRGSLLGQQSLLRINRQRKLNHSASVLSMAPSHVSRDATNVLILGDAASGKSTIVKSLMYVFGCYNVENRHSYLDSIYLNTIQGAKALVDVVERSFHSENYSEVEKMALKRDCDLVSKSDKDRVGSSRITPMVATAVSNLWADLNIRSAFKNTCNEASPRWNFLEYFINSVTRLAQPTYLPTISDILHSYTRSTGVSVSKFESDGKSYNFFDIGGARSERKKWQHMFDATDVVLFTFDVTCSGTPIGTDDTGDGTWLQQAMFRDIVTSPRLARADVVVLFTNVDQIDEDLLERMKGWLGWEATTSDQLLGWLASHLTPSVTNMENRKLTFWKAGIAESPTQMADVVLSALEQLYE